MAGYKTFTSATDMGPYVSKLILELPEKVHTKFVDRQGFSVYVERNDAETSEVVLAKEHHTDECAFPSKGYIPVLSAYASDGEGNPQTEGSSIALKLPEELLTKRIDGALTRGHIRPMSFRITQTKEIPSEGPGEAPLTGMVFDIDTGDVCPDLTGWDLTGSGIFDDIDMNYGFFTPDLITVNAARATRPFTPLPPVEKVPLLVWLHGAGEGQEPYRTVMGNRVTALSSPDIQEKLGGAAYILAPSSPTYWMDSGSGEIADDNKSIYTKALKTLIDEFIEARPDIDHKRIYVGGLSNGGFMTMRLVADYPGFFAAGVPICAPWVASLATDDEMKSIATTPLWFVQSADDPIVTADVHTLANYRRLKELGATDVHITCFDHIEDETGRYHDKFGQPQRYIGHFAWIPAYHDTVKTELDGTNVLVGGAPVTLWQWVGLHRLT